MFILMEDRVPSRLQDRRGADFSLWTGFSWSVGTLAGLKPRAG